MAGTATYPGPTPGLPRIVVQGNVRGSIQVGDNNLQVNENHGTIIFNRIVPTRRERPPSPPPRAPVPYVGREKELRRINDAIAAGSSVAVTGDVGAGRSATLRRAANDAPGTLRILSIEGLGESGRRFRPDDIAQLLYDQVWDTEPREKVTVDTARADLGSMNVLALIDDVAVPDALLNRIGDILPRRPMLVVTSRSPNVDWLLDVSLAPLPRSDAVALITARAGIAERAGMGADTAIKAALEGICELLDDWPGALVIAGKAMAIRHIAPDAARDAIAAAAPQATGGHLTAIQRAYALAEPALDGNARLMLATAAGMPGTTVDAAMLSRVLGDPTWFEDAAEQLKQLDLVRLNTPRFRLQAGLADVVAGSDLSQRSRDRYDKELERALQERRLDWEFMDSELGAALTNLERVLSTGDFEEALVLGRAMNPYLILRGLWGLASDVLHTVNHAAGQIGLVGTVAWTNHELGTLALASGHLDDAERLLTNASQMRESIGDFDGAAYSQHNLARLHPPGPDGPPKGGHGHDHGGGVRIQIVTVLLAIVAVVAFTIGGAPFFVAFVGGLLTGTPTRASPPTEASPQGNSPRPVESPSPAASVIESPTPTPTETPTVTPTLPALTLGLAGAKYSLDWGSWTAEFLVTAAGGSGPYSFTLSNGQASTDNPATFAVRDKGCAGLTLSAVATSSDGQMASIDVPLRPPECDEPLPGVPRPVDPGLVLVCIDTIDLRWDSGGGPLPQHYEVRLSIQQQDGTFTETDRAETEKLDVRLKAAGCGTYELTVEAIDQLDRRSGPSEPLQFRSAIGQARARSDLGPAAGPDKGSS